MKTAKNRAEPPANRQLSFEVANYLLFNRLDQTTTSPGKVPYPEQIQIWSLYSRSSTTYPTMVAVLLLKFKPKYQRADSFKYWICLCRTRFYHFPSSSARTSTLIWKQIILLRPFIRYWFLEKRYLSVLVKLSIQPYDILNNRVT